MASLTKLAFFLRDRRASALGRCLGACYGDSGADGFGLSFEKFAEILEQIARRYLGTGATVQQTAEFLRGLHLEDLALAHGCAEANEAAWNCFFSRYRQKLYFAASAISREESSARDLADSLYADLFGTGEDECGHRVSKLASYTGRGSLEGWLRTVLAQQYVNRYRAQRRFVALDEQTASIRHADRADDSSIAADRRLEQATDEALREVSADGRMILASYYLDGRPLAEIANMLGVHESTVSRRIDKLTHSLRDRIRRGLRQRGMSRRQVEEAMDGDVRNLVVDVRGRLMQGKSE